MKIKSSKWVIIYPTLLLGIFLPFLKQDQLLIIMIFIPFIYLMIISGFNDIEIIKEKQTIWVSNDWLFGYRKWIDFNQIKFVEINEYRGGLFIKIHLNKQRFVKYKRYHYYEFQFSDKDFIKLIQYLEELEIKVVNKVDFSTRR